MRHAAGVGLLCIVVVGRASSGTQEPAEPAHESYLDHVASERAFVTAGASAGIQQARNSPREWGGGAGALFKRFGSTFGKHVVKSSVEFFVAGPLHEDLRYYPSEDARFGPRLRHALASTVVARHTTSGGSTFAGARVSGAMAGGFISRLWQPARLRTVGSGLGSAGISLGVDASANVVREFWPEIRHPRGRSNSQVVNISIDANDNPAR